MLARWFDRSGIGQYLAPDDQVAQEPVPDEARSQIWQILAPDPNFAPAPAPPAAAFTPQVRCQHCGQWTSADGERANPSDVKPNETTPVAPSTPQPHQSCPTTPSDPVVDRLVLSAVKDTAFAIQSPPPRQKLFDKVFRLASSLKMDDNLAKRFRNMLVKDPTLCRARATCLGQLVPDGFTPLMASAYAGQTRAAEIILEIAADDAAALLNDRDYQGRTPLHIAAEYGSVDIVGLLLPKYQLHAETVPSSTMASSKTPNRSASVTLSSPAPVDLLGRTPLGRAMTSPNPKARSHRKQLESQLFSPGDLSVFGVSQPASDRTAADKKLCLVYGTADMPGLRVDMEDALCISRLEYASQTYWLFGVCDGHSDQGRVSNYVATQLPCILPTELAKHAPNAINWTEVFTQACQKIDQDLKATGYGGGSTGVFALIGPQDIVVANVGDSRAMMVQQTTGLEEDLQKMSISESSAEQGYPAPIDEDKPGDVPAAPTSCVAFALSEDHKPDLPEEKKRIENAGLKVEAVTFEENGKEVTIHKVARNSTDQMAVSRSFGDFDYKTNGTLGPDEQAVTAVPDVRVQSRSSADMYLVLACDGVWDVCDEETVKDFVLHQVQIRKDRTDSVLPEVGDALLSESLQRGSRDNMSVILVALSKEAEALQSSLKKALDFS
eukprot:Nitzschia sp. Nitz4//scaffold2_size372955//356511//358508//NITZ4_000479-RA/size372955-processed-gene-0.142-mRNA-1//-1//CDS//3329546946//3330//frame0